ncbi:MAG: Ig-like domain-containing protein [Gemmatimonadaceae bacterium]
MFWSLALQHPAITLSMTPPYDTVRLVATALDANGHPASIKGTVSFASLQPKIVSVDSTGLVHALATGSDNQVTVTVTAGSLIHADTAIINVTAVASPSPMAHLSIHPAGGGDTVTVAMEPFGLFNHANLPVTAVDSNGNPVPAGFAYATWSLDSLVANPCDVGSTQFAACAGNFSYGHPGMTRVVASAMVYGGVAADTIYVKVTPPVFIWEYVLNEAPKVGAPAIPSFYPQLTTVAPGATVLWVNASRWGASGQPVDIVWDDSSNVAAPDSTGILSCQLFGFPSAGGPGGNVAAFGDTTQSGPMPNGCRARKFPTAGVYPYHSTLTGATGEVVVTDGQASGH